MLKCVMRLLPALLLLCTCGGITACCFVIGVLPVPPIRGCPLQDVILTESDFPSRVSSSGPARRSAPPILGSFDDPFDDAYRRFQSSAPSFTVNHAVYFYTTYGRAERGYARYLDGASRMWSSVEGRSTSQGVGPPPEFTYVSPLADEFAVRCGLDVSRICSIVARYEKFVVVLYTDWERNVAPWPYLERWARAIDAKMAACLGKPLP